jgi:hypothetical protein
MITATPPRAIIGTLDQIAAVTRRPADTQSEFYGRVIESGIVLNAGNELKIASVTNPDWRLIRKEDELYFLKKTLKVDDSPAKARDETSTSSLHEHVPDIIKFWTRAKG